MKRIFGLVILLAWAMLITTLWTAPVQAQAVWSQGVVQKISGKSLFLSGLEYSLRETADIRVYRLRGRSSQAYDMVPVSLSAVKRGDTVAVKWQGHERLVQEIEIRGN